MKFYKNIRYKKNWEEHAAWSGEQHYVAGKFCGETVRSEQKEISF